MNGLTGRSRTRDQGAPARGVRPHSRDPSRSGALAPLRSKSGLGDRRRCRRSLNLFLLGVLWLAAFAIAFSGRHFGIPSSNVPSIGPRASAPDAWMGMLRTMERAALVLGDRLGPGLATCFGPPPEGKSV